MPLIPYADPLTLTVGARRILKRVRVKLNIFRMMANADTCFGPTLNLGTAILTKQQLPKELRGLVVLAVARLEGGIYEWVQHVPIGERVGCTKAQIAALEALRFDDASFNARARAMLTLVREVVQNVKASEATVAEATVYFSSKEIVEIILICGYYMMLARLTETTRVDVDAPEGTPVPTWHKVNYAGRQPASTA
jgi:alkylhydroperoxidase family enzyme